MARFQCKCACVASRVTLDHCNFYYTVHDTWHAIVRNFNGSKNENVKLFDRLLASDNGTRRTSLNK